MGNFYIVTNTNCGPCQMFKSKMIYEFVRFLLDNVQNINVFWYEYDPSSGKYNTYEFVSPSEKTPVKVDNIESVMENIVQFPQGVYETNEHKFVDEVITINSPNQWKDILELIKRSPDIYPVYDGFESHDDIKLKNNDRRKSPQTKRRSPQRRRSSPPRSGPKWRRMK